METRTFQPDLEVRQAGGKRLLCGITVPYGVNQFIDEYLTERFESGAFAHQFRAAHRVRLLNYHSNNPAHSILGHAVELRDDAKGLWGEFRVAESGYGDHFLALVREGTLREWSVGFVSDATRMDGRVTVRTKATLFETAMVPQGAYGELASVGAVRAAVPKLARDTLLARLPTARFPM